MQLDFIVTFFAKIYIRENGLYLYMKLLLSFRKLLLIKNFVYVLFLFLNKLCQ